MPVRTLWARVLSAWIVAEPDWNARPRHRGTSRTESLDPDRAEGLFVMKGRVAQVGCAEGAKRPKRGVPGAGSRPGEPTRAEGALRQ